MSTVENPTRIDGSKLPGSENPSTTPPPNSGGAAARVYEELDRLAEFMPERYREVFCFRWGLRGQFSHLTSQAEHKFEIPQATVEQMLTRCLWNIARHAQMHELPAVRAVLGEDRDRWVERAWAHAERRWGNHQSEFSETVLLLCVAGLDVPQAHRVAGQHMVHLGLRRSYRWGRYTSECEEGEPAGQAVDRMLAQVIWPSNCVRLAGLDGFSVRRPLPAWAPEKTGVFRSEKLERLVQFDSDLELLILRQLETDARVAEYQEQPVTIPYIVDGEAHEYTPDVVVRLADGRAFIIEAKPWFGLGDFTNWMKWASLARWCGQAGIGFWVGSPQRSITEHRCMQPDPERHELVADEVQAGAVTEGEYTALTSLVGREQLGLIATAELFDWRTDPKHVRQADGPDREEARRLWALVDRHLDAQALNSRLGATSRGARDA